MGKQHLDTFLVAAGLFKGHCAGERTGNIAGIFMNAAWDLAGRLFETASHLEWAHVAIRFAGPKQPLIIIHDLAGRGEGFECWTDADVTRLVEGEVLPRHRQGELRRRSPPTSPAAFSNHAWQMRGEAWRRSG